MSVRTEHEEASFGTSYRVDPNQVGTPSPDRQGRPVPCRRCRWGPLLAGPLKQSVVTSGDPLPRDVYFPGPTPSLSWVTSLPGKRKKGRNLRTEIGRRGNETFSLVRLFHESMSFPVVGSPGPYVGDGALYLDGRALPLQVPLDVREAPDQDGGVCRFRFEDTQGPIDPFSSDTRSLSRR